MWATTTGDSIDLTDRIALSWRYFILISARVANQKERAEMARLLDEGMDAGLCGFSIQRLGRNSGQADFDGSPMVTDTMCDEDILNLAQVLRARDEGFIEITQATGHIKADTAFVERLADTAQRPILFQDRETPC
jgi:N-acyl-D-amino-acid deacylase